jgi:hypothetical protein
MKRIATIVENGRVVGLVHGPDACDQRIRVNGKEWRFDFDEYGGPLWLRKDGQPRECQNPNKAVWRRWEGWHKRWRAEKAKAQNTGTHGQTPHNPTT